MKNHNMASNIVDLINPLREALNQFLQEKNFGYTTKVTRFAKHSSSSFPVVEIVQRNVMTGEETLNRYEQIDDYTFDINIYAKTLTLEDGTIKTEVEIAEELMYAINELFDVKIGMKRLMCEPIPNLDLNIYRIMLRYTVSYNKRRNNFIRR